MASSIAPLQFFSQDNQNEVKHYSFVHMMYLVLALAEYDGDGIVNSTAVFDSSR